jgi:hypothetical protein
VPVMVEVVLGLPDLVGGRGNCLLAAVVPLRVLEFLRLEASL